MDSGGKGGQRPIRCILEITLRVAINEGLLDILEEGESQLSFKLLVSHAHDRNTKLIDVVKEKFLKLKRLHRILSNPWNQLISILRKIALV